MAIFVVDLVQLILKNYKCSHHSNVAIWPFLKNMSHHRHNQKFFFQCDRAFLFETENSYNGPNHLNAGLVHHIKVTPKPL